MAPPPTLQELIDTVRQDASSDEPLDQLVAAAAAASQLEETTDALLGHFVDRCRRDGRSWTEISAALGVTKQAVHKRFAGSVAAHIVAASPSPTFERFTDRARHVIVDARQQAVGLGDDFVGSEHLLLGLYSEPAGLAARVLAAMDVSLDTVRAGIAAGARTAGTDASQSSAAGEPVPASEPGPAGEPVPAGDTAPGASAAAAAPGSPPFSIAAKLALRDALTVALELSHNYIGTEHLLLGLFRNPESLAAEILRNAGALEATARAHVTDLLRRPALGA